MNGWTILLLLAGQVAWALIGLAVLVRRVCPALRTLRTAEPGLIVDVWAPLALVIPMLFQAGRVEVSVRGIGWVPVGGAVGVGLVGVGWSLWALGGRVAPSRALGGAGGGGLRLSAAIGLAGLILLLLGAAHELTIWTGQCTFAIAAILLWMNTPRPVARAAGDERSGRWLALLALLSLGQGLCAVLVPAAGAEPSAAIALGYALLGGILAARAAGPGWGLRIAGWTAALGTLLGIGTLSLLHLAPQSIAVVAATSGRVPAAVDVQVAYGFGTYAVEGTLLLLLALAVLVRPAFVPLRAMSVALVIVGGGLVAWRLLGLG